MGGFLVTWNEWPEMFYYDSNKALTLDLLNTPSSLWNVIGIGWFLLWILGNDKEEEKKAIRNLSTTLGWQIFYPISPLWPTQIKTNPCDPI